MPKRSNIGSEGQLQKKKKESSKKKSKSVDLEALAATAWEHFRNFIGSPDNDESDDDEQCGDVDELQEIINILQPHVEPFTEKDLSSSSSSFTSIMSLLPVLLSVSYYHLATSNIELCLQRHEQHRHQPYDDNLIQLIEEQISSSLRYFPWNGAMWSMGANFGRCTQTMDPTLVCDWYERAAVCASQVRTTALELLLKDADNHDELDHDEEDRDEEEEELKEEDEIKGWIELLLLQQVAGVEWCDNSEQQAEAKEEGDEGEDNEDDDPENDGFFTFSTVEATARFMAAMLHSTVGRHDQAIPQLTKFRHLTHRLHPNVWTGPLSLTTSNHQNEDTQSPLHSSFTPACFAPTVLPPPVYESLCQLFAPNADYWQESDYGNRGYYSYFMDYEPNRPPQNLMEDVIVQHLLPLAQQVLTLSETTKASKIVGFEWWVHTRPIQANLGHNLHFDTEESFLEQSGEITHPVASSVLYLTGNDQSQADLPDSPAGATIVLDQTPDSKEVAKVCWRNAPKDNTFLVFPGSLLHGVLPCPGVKVSVHENNDDQKAKALKDDELVLRWKTKLETRLKNADKVVVPPPHRLTFMVGFWTRRVPDHMKDRRLYGPCGPLPSDDAKWIQEINRGYGDDNSSNRATMASESIVAQQPIPLISPAWETLPSHNEVEDGDEDTNPSLQLPQAIDHRFFVQNAPQCFRDSLFEKD